MRARHGEGSRAYDERQTAVEREYATCDAVVFLPESVVDSAGGRVPAYVVDASGYQAHLVTHESFACSLYEASS